MILFCMGMGTFKKAINPYLVVGLELKYDLSFSYLIQFGFYKSVMKLAFSICGHPLSIIFHVGLFLKLQVWGEGYFFYFIPNPWAIK